MKLNGDNIKGIRNKFLYFKQCLKNHNTGDEKKGKILKVQLFTKNIKTIRKSPSRILCDAFWNTLDWKKISFELDDKIHILDLGCGNGNYGYFLKEISGDNFGTYTGLDIYKHKNFPDEFKHIKDYAENSYKYIRNVNVIISQSTLEHVENDIDTIEKIISKNRDSKKFIQIHLVPASAGLWLYLLHGWRQYSNKNIGKITEQIKKKFNLDMISVPIGGKSSFWTHLKRITIPIVFNKVIKRNNWSWHNQKNINKIMSESAFKDTCSGSEFPSFWAIIIVSEKKLLRFKSIEKN